MYIGSSSSLSFTPLAGGSVAAIHEHHSVGYDTVLEVVCSRLWTLPGTTTCIQPFSPFCGPSVHVESYTTNVQLKKLSIHSLEALLHHLIHCVGLQVLTVTSLTVVHQLSYLWGILAMEMGGRVTRLRCTFIESFTTTQTYFWYSHFSFFSPCFTVSSHPFLSFPLPIPS